MKYQQRENTGLYTYVIDVPEQPLRTGYARYRNIAENGAKSNGQQQQRFELFLDGQIDQQTADQHHEKLPRNHIGNPHRLPECLEVIHSDQPRVNSVVPT